MGSNGLPKHDAVMGQESLNVVFVVLNESGQLRGAAWHRGVSRECAGGWEVRWNLLNVVVAGVWKAAKDCGNCPFNVDVQVDSNKIVHLSYYSTSMAYNYLVR